MAAITAYRVINNAVPYAYALQNRGFAPLPIFFSEHRAQDES